MSSRCRRSTMASHREGNSRGNFCRWAKIFYAGGHLFIAILKKSKKSLPVANTEPYHKQCWTACEPSSTFQSAEKREAANHVVTVLTDRYVVSPIKLSSMTAHPWSLLFAPAAEELLRVGDNPSVFLELPFTHKIAHYKNENLRWSCLWSLSETWLLSSLKSSMDQSLANLAT